MIYGLKDKCPILMADDDPDDQLLLRRAMDQKKVRNPLVFIDDGESLIKYLKSLRAAQGPEAPAEPCLILLDLNMPRLDGREALRLIKADEALRQIPVVILTTSKAPEDVATSYQGGANSYIIKPDSFEKLVAIVETLRDYWFGTVELPPHKE